MLSPVKSRGFTMIEVLIAMLVLLIGLLGVSAMLLEGMQNSRDSLYRAQATTIAQDLLDRVRSNPTAVNAGLYSNVHYSDTTQTPALTTVNCASAACGSADVASYDLRMWARNFVTSLSDYQASLPQGTGRAGIVPDPTNACGGLERFDVAVSWYDVSDAADNSVEMSICLDV